jgi:hypothetical protein
MGMIQCESSGVRNSIRTALSRHRDSMQPSAWRAVKQVA